jgi:AcrR family transcriptional regulator
MVNTRRRAGRPPAGESVAAREALLAAAESLFIRYGFRAVSTRQLGQKAAVNPALIRYYFGGKLGLYRTMVEQAIAPVMDSLATAQARPDEATLETLVGTYQRMLAAHPWLPGLLVREVLPPDGRFRASFRKIVAQRAAPMLRGFIAQSMRAGRMRRDLDPDLTLLSMLGMTVFPFIAYPLTREILGPYLADDRRVEALVAHTARLLQQGVASPGDVRT